VGEPGPVGAHQDPPIAHRFRQLRQRQIKHGDVIGGGVRPGVTRAQDPGERLVGVIQIGQQRVIPETVSVD